MVELMTITSSDTHTHTHTYTHVHIHTTMVEPMIIILSVCVR